MVLFAYRVKPGPNGPSPFQLLFGTSPQLPTDWTPAELEHLPSHLLRRWGLDQAKLARLNLPPVYFTSDTPRFRPGDRVLCLRTKAVRGRAGLGKVPKFTELFSGPYTVVRRELPRLYRLQNVQGERSRNLVNESRLVPYHARALGASGGAREAVASQHNEPRLTAADAVTGL